MAAGAKHVWVFRIVHQDTGNPAAGVPVTVLDAAGNPAGHWVSGADGTVEIPRREGASLRLRVGLRNEEPIEIASATVGEGPIDLPAPTWLPTTAPSTVPGDREPPAAPAPRPAEPGEPPGHVLYFQRLVMFVERTAGEAAPRERAADFFTPRPDEGGPLRYGALIEVEEFWQSLGVQWGDLLYSVSLTPGDEARLAVLDGRWRREVEGRERPLQILARMVGSSMLGDLVSALRPELQLDPLTLSQPGLDGAASDTVQLIRDRTERMSQALRRRPLGVVDANREAPSQAAIRTVRNTTPDRVVTFHFFEPLERFKVVLRTPRARAVILVPFQPPNLATPAMVRRFAYVFRRTLLDRGLLAALDRLLRSGDEGVGGEIGLLLDHIAANLLYYSAAIISAGDPAARHVALSKLRDPAGRPLTEVAENTVLGRIGNYIALPLRAADQLPREWRGTLATYAARPARVTEGFTVAIPHPGVWVRAEPHEPMQGRQERSAAG
ncbi:MAG TPA: hypothetical protein VEK78_07460 [Gemmatimonadales bacterium]|nr:hypothetical protein [Gemmatimonadales bacterium]